MSCHSRLCLGKRSLRSKGTSVPCLVLWLLTHDILRVKADSLFSYQPPVNLVAVCILLPASYVLSPRWFHKVRMDVFLVICPLIGRKVNVFLIRSLVLDISTTKLLSAYPSCRVTNFPILLIIAWYERESATLMSNCARSCLHRSSKENCLAWILRNNFIRV